MIFATLLLLGGRAEDEAAKAAEAVVTLTNKNFDTVVGASERIMVEFYAPWCGHCKALEPEYKKAAEEMKAEGLKTVLAKVDATEESELSKRYGVSGYPTLVYITGQKSQNYEGERNAAAIKSWLRKREEPDVLEIKEEEVESFLGKAKEGEVAMVARVKKKSGRAKAFFQASSEYLVDFEAATILKAAVWLPKTADPKADANLTMFRPGFQDPDPQRLYFEGAWTGQSVAKWAKSATYPTVARVFASKKLSESIMQDMGWDGFVVALVDDGDLGEEESEEALTPKVLSQLHALALLEPKWKFIMSEIDKLQESDLGTLGVRKGAEPTLSVVKDGKKYLLEGAEEMSKPSSIKTFLDKVKSKEVKPSYKSEPVPNPEVDAEDVTVLVGKSFEQHVLNSKKDVFVEFYAPWCGHCKKLAPVWAQLAKKVKDAGWRDRGVVIAKMDATENECDEEVTGFPRLVLYPAVKADRKFKQKQVYGGERELGPLVDFLLENSKNLEGVENFDASGKKKVKHSMIEREMEKQKKAKKREL